MTLNYAPLLTEQEYKDAIVSFITGIEGQEPNVYRDSDGMATIGYGYTFNRNNNVALWQAAGISLSATDLALLKKIDEAPNEEKTKLGLTFTRVVTKPEATSLLLKTYPEYETLAVNTLHMPFSYERVAFVSLTYNYGKGNVTKYMQDFLSAVQTGNRAEAWFQMRYNSFRADGTRKPGLPKRRYLESAMFSMYSDQTGMSQNEMLAESKDIYRMFTKHRTKIAGYEEKFGVGFDGKRGTTTIYKSGRTPLEEAQAEAASYAGINSVDSIRDALQPACDDILADLAGNANSDTVHAFQKWKDNGHDPATFNPLDLYLDSNTGAATCSLIDTSKDYRGGVNANDSILIGGETHENNLIGGNGNDLIIGGNKNDYIKGGKGNDIMAGGDGDDTYIINEGDGNDTIEDKLGAHNKIIFNGKDITFFYKDGQLFWSPDKAFKGEYRNTDFIITDTRNNQELTLNADFQEGDFGIRFIDKPAEGLPEIYYDGTAAAERITGGSTEYYGRGGNDIMLGLPDSTALLGNVLQGDDGNDYLFSSDTEITTQQAIDNGNTDTSLYPDYVDGDWLAGNAGNDVLIAGANDDLLAGGGGNDLLIAGAGDDVIYGDVDFNRDTQTGGTNGNLILNRLADGTAEFSAPSLIEDPADSGNDTIHAGNGKDYVMAGKGNDVIYGEGDDDYLAGEEGNDVLFGGDGLDKMWGNDGNDYLEGGAGDDILSGDNGDGSDGRDQLWGNGGNDYLNGLAANDTSYGNSFERRAA